MHKCYCAFILLISFATATFAQHTEALPVPKQIAEKPQLFSSLPGRISISKPELIKLFEAGLASTIHLYFQNLPAVQCTIVDRVQRSAQLRSVNIILPAFENALFTISEVVQEDHTHRYIGRIIHPRYGDAYQLTFENNQYFLDKQKQRLFMVE